VKSNSAHFDDAVSIQYQYPATRNFYMFMLDLLYPIQHNWIEACKIVKHIKEEGKNTYQRT